MNGGTRKPYNQLPPLPPDADLETKPVLKQCVSANRALAELKGAGDLIPNQAVLINTIPLREAQGSSEVENIVTTSDLLFRAAVSKDADVDPATKEVLRYRTALRHGCDLLDERPLSTNLLCEVCSVLLDRPVDVRTTPGTQLANPFNGKVVYTPPVGEQLIRDKLANLEEFIHTEDDLDPLVRMAVVHYQFEAIHPFPDGNGRTGRILNILYLIAEGLLHIPVLYLSRHIIEHKSDYYTLLRRVTEDNAWEPWIQFMLTAVEETASWTCEKIFAIRDLMEQTVERCRTELPDHVYSKELVEIVFTQPYCKIAFVVDAGIAKRQTASQYLQELEEIGVLESEKIGRERIFTNPRLLSLLGEP
ncbi:MAG: Fic family protein [Candidatus Brocadiia bacterium]